MTGESAAINCSAALDIDAIQREVADGYINEQRHPTEPYRILNYSQRAQFDWRWNNETMQCRGLIVDDSWNVIARPFPKFFSVEQLNGVVPVEPFEAYEKMDGSLGVLYHIDGQPQIASRGSFTSDQAQRATAMLSRLSRESNRVGLRQSRRTRVAGDHRNRDWQRMAVARLRFSVSGCEAIRRH